MNLVFVRKLLEFYRLGAIGSFTFSNNGNTRQMLEKGWLEVRTDVQSNQDYPHLRISQKGIRALEDLESKLRES